jgi:hypothetical protein
MVTRRSTGGEETYVYDSVLEDANAYTIDVHRCLRSGTTRGVTILEHPALPLLVDYEAWVVVALVEVLEHRRENLWLFVGKADLSLPALPVLAADDMGEVGGRIAQNVLMCSKEALITANADGDDG